MRFYLNFLLNACFKSPQAHPPTFSDWYTDVTSRAAVNSDARSTQISHLEIFGYAAKQACKQLQCIKAKLSEPYNLH